MRVMWSPSFTVSRLLLSIYSLLTDPNADDPLVPAIADAYKNEREKYNENVQLWTEKFALDDNY